MRRFYDWTERKFGRLPALVYIALSVLVVILTCWAGYLATKYYPAKPIIDLLDKRTVVVFPKALKPEEFIAIFYPIYKLDNAIFKIGTIGGARTLMPYPVKVIWTVIMEEDTPYRDSALFHESCDQIKLGMQQCHEGQTEKSP